MTVCVFRPALHSVHEPRRLHQAFTASSVPKSGLSVFVYVNTRVITPPCGTFKRNIRYSSRSILRHATHTQAPIRQSISQGQRHQSHLAILHFHQRSCVYVRRHLMDVDMNSRPPINVTRHDVPGWKDINSPEKAIARLVKKVVKPSPEVEKVKVDMPKN